MFWLIKLPVQDFNFWVLSFSWCIIEELLYRQVKLLNLRVQNTTIRQITKPCFTNIITGSMFTKLKIGLKIACLHGPIASAEDW